MGYLALYRKYRPTSFDDLVGQKYISDIIKKELLNNQISHAYLFSGPRGTGKTSTAKIIARMINCLNLDENGNPCGKCDNCLNINNNNDIVEIDAASNNGVDEIRELKDKINLVPTTSKYKIYIIDEVHMLTIQAFNALLKTLEEPPSHVIFILATTELYKIPITVISRCQKFQFTKFSIDDVVSRLSYISNVENIDISSDSLYEIARLSDGGLRDAINMLDQLSSFKSSTIDIYDVYKLNGVLSFEDMFSLLNYIYECNTNKIIEFFENIDKNGNDLVRFLEDFISFLKEVILYVNSSITSNIVEKQNIIGKVADIYSFEDIYNLIFSLNDLINKIKNSSCMSILVTVFFLKLCVESKKNNSKLDNTDNSSGSLNNKVFDDKNELSDISKNNFKKEDFVLSANSKKVRINNAFASASKKNKEYVSNNWSLLEEKVINSKYASIASFLNDIEVAVVGEGYIIIYAKYDSLVQRLYNFIILFENLFSETFEKKYKIVFLAKDEWIYERDKYIVNLKKGIKYNMLDDNENVTVYSDENSDINKIVSLLGEDVVEYS